MSKEVKNLASCGDAAGDTCKYKYTNNWNLDQLEPNKNKWKKYKMRGK